MQHDNETIHQSNALLIRPNVDCSEKELYTRNGYQSPVNNFVNLIKTDDKITSSRTVTDVY